MLFKWFLIIVGGIIGISLCYYVFGKVKLFIQDCREKHPKKRELTKEELFEQKTLDFEKELSEQYKKSITALLTRAKLAQKTSDILKKSIDEYTQNARKCKAQYLATKNEGFQKNAYIFLAELENAKKLLELSNNTVKECINKVDVAEIDYQALICRIQNKKIEYTLLNSIGEDRKNKGVNNVYEKEFDYNQLLNEYKDKIDIKKVDIEIEKNMSEQKALNPASNSFDWTLIPESLKIEYEKL